jgi:hypothetical protein
LRPSCSKPKLSAISCGHGPVMSRGPMAPEQHRNDREYLRLNFGSWKIWHA